MLGIKVSLATLYFALCLFTPSIIFAHCDTLDGPVVKDARRALANGDVTPVLKWVKEENEGEVQNAFNKALIKRTQNPETKEEADMEFFETLVRLHRQGEEAPFTGLKPASFEVDPAVAQADKALEKGTVDDLVKLMTEKANLGIRQRFNQAFEKKQRAEENIEAGREYVEAYIEFIHYVERLYGEAVGQDTSHHQ